MKKGFIIALITIMITVSVCTSSLAVFHKEPKTTVYRGEEWHFDIEKKEYPYITITPKDKKEPQVYGNGYVDKVKPEEKKYDIILLGQ